MVRSDLYIIRTCSTVYGGIYILNAYPLDYTFIHVCMYMSIANSRRFIRLGEGVKADIPE